MTLHVALPTHAVNRQSVSASAAGGTERAGEPKASPGWIGRVSRPTGRMAERATLLAVLALAGCGGESGPAARPVGGPAQCQERVVDFIDAAYLEEGDVYEPRPTVLALEVQKACAGAPRSESVGSAADLVRSRLFIEQSGF